jgi:RNA polymerase sigma factor (sigma-70 family)
MGRDDSTTSSSLIRRAHQWDDRTAWDELVIRYQPLILDECRRLGLGGHELEEALQRVLIRLARRMKTFNYDPSRSFRGWLRTLVRSQVVEDWRRRGAAGRDVLDGRVEWLGDREGPAEPVEDDHPLLEQGRRVQAEVRARVGAETWEIFWMADLEGVPMVEVARRFGKTYHAAFRARQRVRTLLAEAGRRALEERGEGGASGP